MWRAAASNYARKLLTRAFAPEVAKRLLDRLTKALGADAASFDAIQKADPQLLAKFIHNEHPQTIALVLSHLNSSQAAALLTSLPPGMRSDVAQRMASLDQISPEVIMKIAAVIGQKLNALGEFSRESYGGVRAVAEMMNRLDSASSREILDHIETAGYQPGGNHPAPHVRLRRPAADRSDGLEGSHGEGRPQGADGGAEGHQRAIAEPDPGQHVAARRGDAEEDMEALGPIKIKEVEAAQQQIIAIVRQLEAEGVVSLKGTVGEQYVV